LFKKKTVKVYRFISETYYEIALSIKTCEYWLRRFKSNDFDLKDKELRLNKKVRRYQIAGIIGW